MHFFRRFHKRFLMRLHDHHGGGRRARGPKMFDAGALRYIVLQLIADQPRHGYEIIKEIEDRVGGDYAPSPGAIYPLLALLEDLGHVVVTSEGNKKLHTITPVGRAFLKENRAFVDAISARMAMLSGKQRRGDGFDYEGIRTAMHEIKAVLMARSRGSGFSDEQSRQIEAILARAATDIRKII
jgi:DNA-binding PadR family transcriptional regulator